MNVSLREFCVRVRAYVRGCRICIWINRHLELTYLFVQMDLGTVGIMCAHSHTRFWDRRFADISVYQQSSMNTW